MSLTTRIFSNLLQKGLKEWINNAGNIMRNYHALAAKQPLHNLHPTPTNQQISETPTLLSPVTSILNQVMGFKVKARLRRRCKDCLVVVRQQRPYIICPTHPRHKQMAMKKRDYKSWILTHATQSKVRPY